METMSYTTDDMGAVVEADGAGYKLTVTDYVASEWSETFPDMASAMLRLAVLVRCAEREWGLGFAKDAAGFAVIAESFLSVEAV